ncbi:MAG: uroporphyrinogen-III synthase [Hydrogenophilaceae bacterium]|nr:uroporphyrinogen-III synthase [Hydrogenophilaceae bacterium]
MADPSVHLVNPNRPLEGKRILVTRPREQSDRLAKLVESAGGVPVICPAIEILGPSDPATLDRRIEQLDSYDLAIFISPTAAEWCLKSILARREWPSDIAVAAVGQATARRLETMGFRDIISPEDQADSESLLKLSGMKKVAGKRIIIFRGEGGRELLADTLRKRGAEIDYAECYHRARPDSSNNTLPDILRQTNLSAITVTSSEGLVNLLEMAGSENLQQIASIPFFVLHERIAIAARNRGIHTVVTTKGSDSGLLDGMVKFFQS